MRAAAVEVDAVGEGGHESRSAREFLGVGGAELDYCRVGVAGGCEVYCVSVREMGAFIKPVGGQGLEGEEWEGGSRKIPLSRAIWLRLNSFDMIMGVHERSTPYSCTVCRNASWATPSQPIPARNSGTLGLGNSPCYSAPWGQRRRRSDPQPSQHQISSADLRSSSLAFPENSPPQACCFNLLQGRADSFITDLGIHFGCHESHAALPLPFLSPWLGSCGCLILSSCWIYLAPPVPRFRSVPEV